MYGSTLPHGATTSQRATYKSAWPDYNIKFRMEVAASEDWTWTSGNPSQYVACLPGPSSRADPSDMTELGNSSRTSVDRNHYIRQGPQVRAQTDMHMLERAKGHWTWGQAWGHEARSHERRRPSMVGCVVSSTRHREAARMGENVSSLMCAPTVEHETTAGWHAHFLREQLKNKSHFRNST